MPSVTIISRKHVPVLRILPIGAGTRAPGPTAAGTALYAGGALGSGGVAALVGSGGGRGGSVMEGSVRSGGCEASGCVEAAHRRRRSLLCSRCTYVATARPLGAAGARWTPAATTWVAV